MIKIYLTKKIDGQELPVSDFKIGLNLGQRGKDGEVPGGVVVDQNYVHTDNNYDDAAVLEVAKIPDKANTSDVNTALGNKADLVNGLIPSSQLPSYVDDVVEVANFAELPETGESGKIYITQDDNLTYRWSGTGYAEISKSLALGETSGTAYRGDRGKTAYDHSQTTGNPHGTNIDDLSNVDLTETTPLDTDSVLIQQASTGKIKKSLFSTLKTWLEGKALTLSQVLKVDSIRNVNGSGAYVSEDGGTIWHKGNDARWFTPTGGSTFSSSGTTVTLTGSNQLTSAMIGAKIGINGDSLIPDKRIITAVNINGFQCTIDRAFDTNYSGVSDWGVWSIEQKILNSIRYFYKTDGTSAFKINQYGQIQISNELNTESNRLRFDQYELKIGSSYPIRWGNFNDANSTKDLGLYRNSEGVLEINNGTAGTFRDLKLRSLFADKIMLNAINTAPSSATDTGTAGEIRIDANYIYFCVATNQWKRTPLSTW